MGWKGTIVLTYELSVTFDGNETRPASEPQGSPNYRTAEEALGVARGKVQMGIADGISRELKAVRVEEMA